MSNLRGETERLLRWELEQAVKRIVELEERNRSLDAEIDRLLGAVMYPWYEDRNTRSSS